MIEIVAILQVSPLKFPFTFNIKFFGGHREM